MGKKYSTGVGLVLLLLTALALASASSAVGQEEKKALRVNGAGMSADQVQLWAKAFTEANPGLNVVVTGSSAGKGFNDLFSGMADVAMASRIISAEEQKKAAEKKLNLDTRLIGYAGLAIVTSKRNPVDELTMEQLRKIFLGEYTNWNQVGGPDEPIRCLTRRVPESGGAVFFMSEVLHNRPYGPTSQAMETWSSILKVCAVAKDLPIGLAPAMAVTNNGEVKILAIKQDTNTQAAKPTLEAMSSKAYPIIMPFWFYWDSQTKDDRVKPFIEFCASRGLAAEAAKK